MGKWKILVSNANQCKSEKNEKDVTCEWRVSQSLCLFVNDNY